jgi:serine/threonine-protein kinase HipA
LRSFRVSLGEVVVGYLSEDDRGRVSFRFLDEYRQLSHRPVLSQSFEDDLERIYRGKSNELPPFFANLVQEGPLRNLVETSLGISPGDDMALLEAVGRDLPGAVEIVAAEGVEDPVENGFEELNEGLLEGEAEEGLLRFSLAGVQLKFSVLREAEKLTLPLHNQRGEWIVKLDSARFPHLVENEFAVLEWARGAGFEVPECYVQPSSSLASTLQPYAIPETNVLVIRRYDRDGARRIHQEDFAQVVSLPPRLKYDQISYEQCALLVRQIVSEEAYFECVRRLTFMVASGNTDAHLKNWSLIYKDDINASLSPLYDQVCTIAWSDVPRALALKFNGKKHLLQLDEDAFVKLAEKAHMSEERTLSAMRDSLERIAAAWQGSAIDRLMPPEHAAILREYWESSRLLKLYVKSLQR